MVIYKSIMTVCYSIVLVDKQTLFTDYLPLHSFSVIVFSHVTCEN